jgi:hypothetical protein
MPSEGVTALQEQSPAVEIGFGRCTFQVLGATPHGGCEGDIGSDPLPFRRPALGLAAQPLAPMHSFRLRTLQAKIAGAIGKGISREGVD